MRFVIGIELNYVETSISVRSLFSQSPKWLILALHVVLVCFMIFPGTMFAVICKQERSVCYLLRLSKSQSIIQLGDSTQSKQIRKMYFNASFIKSIIISIYSLTISTISSHSFLLVIIFNQWHKKIPKKNSMVIGSFQKNVLNVWSVAASRVTGPKFSGWFCILRRGIHPRCYNSSSPLRKHLHFCQKPYVPSKNRLVARYQNSRTWPRAESCGGHVRLVSGFSIL